MAVVMSQEPTRLQTERVSTAVLTRLAQEGVEQAIARMHSKGLPVIRVKNNAIYKEYPDGRWEWVKNLTPAGEFHKPEYLDAR